MTELFALLAALAAPHAELNYLAVGHMSGSTGASGAGTFGSPGTEESERFFSVTGGKTSAATGQGRYLRARYETSGSSVEGEGSLSPA
jgi:hypothetical protein